MMQSRQRKLTLGRVLSWFACGKCKSNRAEVNQVEHNIDTIFETIPAEICDDKLIEVAESEVPIECAGVAHSASNVHEVPVNDSAVLIHNTCTRFSPLDSTGLSDPEGMISTASDSPIGTVEVCGTTCMVVYKGPISDTANHCWTTNCMTLDTEETISLMPRWIPARLWMYIQYIRVFILMYILRVLCNLTYWFPIELKYRPKPITDFKEDTS